jgi:hypothetical protein
VCKSREKRSDEETKKKKKRMCLSDKVEENCWEKNARQGNINGRW